jgi:hypothetical protein
MKVISEMNLGNPIEGKDVFKTASEKMKKVSREIFDVINSETNGR